MSNNHINQAIPTFAQYDIATLSSMPTALNGEQYPLNQKAVDALVESFIDGTPLLTLPEVTRYNGVSLLTGGRHRVASLEIEYADDTARQVTVLEYTADTPEQLIERITASNGSRRMVASEKKDLVTAGKYGFGTVTVESLVAQIDTVVTTQERLDLFMSALALKLDDCTDCGKNTALVVSRSILVAAKKWNHIRINPATVDNDGTQLTSASKTKVNVLSEVLTMGTDSIMELLDTIVFSIDYMEATEFDVTASAYLKALPLEMVQPANEFVKDAQVFYTTTVSRPTAWQRNASKWVALASPFIKSYVAESLDLDIA
jgi:limonene-1,2-epoxide hydrolase